ncbi:MAG: uroporphyrinogen-III synthase [Pseudomonadota bacterium]
MTRPQPEADRQASILADRGLAPIISPLLQVRPAPLSAEALDTLAGAGTIVATSRNALRSLESAPVSLLATIKAHTALVCVGADTAELARALGYQVVVAGDGNAAELAPLAVATAACRSGPLVRLERQPTTANQAAGFKSPPDPIVVAAEAAGQTVARLPVYRVDTVPDLTPQALAAFRNGALDLVVLMSPATSRAFISAAARGVLTLASGLPVYVCISAAAAAPLEHLPQRCIIVADKPNQAGVLSAVDRAVARLS